MDDLVFKALADRTRRRIVEALEADALPVHEIARPFRMSRPAISKHLRILGEAGLVTHEKRGKEIYYALHPPALEAVRAYVARFWRGRLETLKRLSERDS